MSNTHSHSLSDVTLIYVDDNGETYPQPVSDLIESGTLDDALDPDSGEKVELELDRVEVTTPDPDPLDLGALHPGEFRVSWEVDQDADSAAVAAVQVWRNQFGRVEQPSVDECCVFTVASPDGREVTVDLSDGQYAHLF